MEWDVNYERDKANLVNKKIFKIIKLKQIRMFTIPILNLSFQNMVLQDDNSKIIFNSL